jgi:hypothetical protein
VYPRPVVPVCTHRCIIHHSHVRRSGEQSQAAVVGLVQGLRAQGTGHRAQGTGHRAQGTRLRAQGSNSGGMAVTGVFCLFVISQNCLLLHVLKRLLAGSFSCAAGQAPTAIVKVSPVSRLHIYCGMVCL